MILFSCSSQRLLCGLITKTFEINWMCILLFLNFWTSKLNEKIIVGSAMVPPQFLCSIIHLSCPEFLKPIECLSVCCFCFFYIKIEWKMKTLGCFLSWNRFFSDSFNLFSVSSISCSKLSKSIDKYIYTNMVGGSGSWLWLVASFLF